ncbi:MAG: hypothetical protein IJP89_07075 [Synergistaceae bacterium]|nr:hypothetical protein [Synergistaceae bacterium]
MSYSSIARVRGGHVRKRKAPLTVSEGLALLLGEIPGGTRADPLPDFATVAGLIACFRSCCEVIPPRRLCRA